MVPKVGLVAGRLIPCVYICCRAPLFVANRCILYLCCVFCGRVQLNRDFPYQTGSPWMPTDLGCHRLNSGLLKPSNAV